MSGKNFLNYHVIISHSPSCINRDDMNMQKSAFFGGARRVRVSSQSLKRAMRTSKYYRQELGEASKRTNKIDYLKDFCAESDILKEFDKNFVDDVIDMISETGKYKKSKDKKKKKEVEEGEDSNEGKEKKQAVAPWCLHEIKKYCEIVKKATEEGKDYSAIKKLLGKEKGENKGNDSLLASMGRAKDIALSGRMATSGLMTKIDGAMAVAHSITTHAVDADMDWFAAVDDLVLDKGEVGAGHLETQEFSSGVFYRYASLNIGQLMTNMGADRKAALDVAAHMARLMATVTPDAKRNSFGQDNPADLVLVSFSDMPLSFANAFERPVKPSDGSGFLVPSLQAFEGYMERVHKGYGIEERHKVFSLPDTDITPKAATLSELMDWIRADGE